MPDPTPSTPLDINSASQEDLVLSVPKLGPALAARLVSLRPYQKLEDLLKVPGFGAATLERMRPYLTVSAVESAAPLPENPLAEPVHILDEKAETENHPVENKLAEILPVSEHMEHSTPAAKIIQPVMPVIEPPQPAAVEQPSVLPSQEPTTPAAAAPSPATGTSSSAEKPHSIWEGFLIQAGIGFIILVLSVVLTLGILRAVNGTLQFTDQNTTAALDQRLTQLEKHATTLDQDISALRTRVDAIESLSGRLTTLEAQSQTIQTDIQTLSTQLEELNRERDELRQQVTELQKSSNTFSLFLQNLQQLLNQTLPTEGSIP